LSSPPGFSRPGLQAANGFELGFQGNLEGIKHDRFDLFFVHRVLLSGCCKGGYDRRVGMSTNYLPTQNVQTPAPLPLGDVTRGRVRGESATETQGSAV